MNIICDNCNYGFETNVKTEILHIDGQEILHVYMECPKCKTKYTVTYDNNETLELCKTIKRYLNYFNRSESEIQRKRIQIKIKNVRKKLKDIRKELDGKVEH